LGRALAAIRIVAAYASGRPVIQRVTPAGSGQSSSGEVVVGSRTAPRAVVSSAISTAEDEELRDALARLTTAHYSREQTFDSQLDEALEAMARRADRLIAERPWTEKLWPR
jgi:hypothetical protein